MQHKFLCDYEFYCHYLLKKVYSFCILNSSLNCCRSWNKRMDISIISPQKRTKFAGESNTWEFSIWIVLYVFHVHLNLCFKYVESQGSNEAWPMRNSRRLMIGSTAPTCTYNECRGCKYKCRAEQVPVEGNDPINSPYHYRCVCHR